MLAAAVLLLLMRCPANAERTTVSLDGPWEIEDSLAAEQVPDSFTHHVPVPGLAHLSVPAFDDVDKFESRELLWRREQLRRLGLRCDQPGESAREGVAGIPKQNRNYFWYRKRFRLPADKSVAILKINKAQFGTAVWLNGKKLGEYPGCFSASYFPLAEAADWGAENTLVVRVGAHPGVLPDTYPTGTNFEKADWTPGIYDSVSILVSDNPVIEWVQVAPRVATNQIVVQTRVKNYGPAGRFAIEHSVSACEPREEVANSPPRAFSLAVGESKTLIRRIAIPSPTLWSPDSPFLYVVNTSTGGDDALTRFGMREFRFDSATGRGYLNGEVCYLRGSNIILSHFFEDPLSGDLPWRESWVRRLLIEIPRQMHWNSFRVCLGPFPDRWLDIADEGGLLLQNEFFIWTARPSEDYFRHWDKDELLRQFQDWMRDNWNHPSVVIWDTCNETHDEVLGNHIIPAVRPLDLSNRPWENGYNPPAGPDDPVEEHPYLFIRSRLPDDNKFEMQQLQTMDGRPRRAPPGHAVILNEYDWLWLHRDGTPTSGTEYLYPKYLGPRAKPQERFEFRAYCLAGLTEFWRAHRHFSGVLYNMYLNYDKRTPQAYTSDNFADVVNLKLEPRFESYLKEAFKPLGVYVNFWQPSLPSDSKRVFKVMMVNDTQETACGRLVLAWEPQRGGPPIVEVESPFEVAPVGNACVELEVAVPPSQGNYVLTAKAFWPGKPWSPTVCRRKVAVEAPKAQP